MINYDAWLTNSGAYEEFIGADEDDELEEYDYCDAHEEEWKLAGEW